MATVLNNNNKYSLRYTLTDGVETSGSRTISGLNIGGGSGSQTGPYSTSAITTFIAHVGNFTNGTFGGVRWITEQEVDLNG